MPEVTLDRATKVHRDRRGREVVALRAASLEVRAGENLMVVGPSGSGKTTLLRLIAGLETPTSGTVRLGTRSVTDVPARERGMAMVFQDHPLFPHRTVEGNLELGLELRRVAKAERTKRVEEALEWLGLSALRQRLPETLSGGERQRVALGMALVQRPSVVLLDEPLAQLDPAWRLALRRDFRDLQRRLRWTWVQTTHDQAEALASADRLVVLESGAVRQIGTPQSVYDRPENRFVAGFLGTPPMNLLTGTLRSDASGAWRMQGDDGTSFEGRGSLPKAWSSGVGVRTVFGVRPEAVSLIEDGGRDPSPGDGMLGRGDVVAAESMGHETWVQVRVGAKDWIVARSPGTGVWRSGRNLGVFLPTHAIHRFAPDEAGCRLEA